MSAKPTHQAVCLVCYTSILHAGNKRACELACTSHIGAYGHPVTILKVQR